MGRYGITNHQERIDYLTWHLGEATAAGDSELARRVRSDLDAVEADRNRAHGTLDACTDLVLPGNCPAEP